MSLLQRFEQVLGSIPPPGGNGCHPYLLKAAIHGVRAGVPPDEIHAIIASHIPRGTRIVTDREIHDAVSKALQQPTPMPGVRRAPPFRFDAKAFLAARLREGASCGEAEIWDVSPVRIDWQPQQDAEMILTHLYRPDDIIFVGSRHETTPHPVRNWLDHVRTGGALGEHVIPNPLTGRMAKTKDGKDSYRADACVAHFRFAVVEFDSLPRADQLAFWATVNLPIVALIDSGGKSIHAWIATECRDADEWTSNVENRLYRDFLTPMGVDSACRNEARLSRMPGVFRAEKSRWQRLLYLNPSGDKGRICVRSI